MAPPPYTREELRSVGDAMPTRGKYCPQCERFIPEFAELTAVVETRIRELLRQQRAADASGHAVVDVLLVASWMDAGEPRESISDTLTRDAVADCCLEVRPTGWKPI